VVSVPAARRRSRDAGSAAVPTAAVPAPAIDGGAPATRAGRLLVPGLVGTAGLAAIALVAAVSPEQPGHYPLCPTYALTGLYCPGCGGLRAVHALAHGDVALALHRNPLVVLALPVAVWAYLAWVRRRALGRPLSRLPAPTLIWGFVALGVLFGVLRNLPALGWLAP